MSRSRRASRRWLALGGVLIAGLLLSGCVYFRLLELKRQLADFDRYFGVADTEGLALTFREPVLRGEDLTFLGLAPEKIERLGAAERWRFRWVKDPPSATESPDRHELSAELIFAEQKLARLILPERFFAFFPKSLFLHTLRSFGRAKIDRRQRIASVDIGLDAEPVVLPTLDDIAAMLGEPLEQSVTAAGIVCRYRYRNATPGQHAGNIDMTFTFDARDKHLRRLAGQLLRNKIDLTFPVQVQLPPS